MKTITLIMGLAVGVNMALPDQVRAAEATDVSARMPELVAVGQAGAGVKRSFADFGTLRGQENAVFKQMPALEKIRSPLKREVGYAEQLVQLGVINRQQRAQLVNAKGILKEIRGGVAKNAPEMIAIAEDTLRGIQATMQAGIAQSKGTLRAMSAVVRIGGVSAEQTNSFNAAAATYRTKLQMEQTIAGAQWKTGSVKERMESVLNNLDNTEAAIDMVLAVTDANGVMVDVAKIDHILTVLLKEIGFNSNMLLENSNDYSTLVGGGSAGSGGAVGRKSALELADEFGE